MTDTYFFRQLLLVANQMAVMIYTGIMSSRGNLTGGDSVVHLLLITLLFCDACYISYRNIKSSRILTHFSFLLLLLGWQLLLSLSPGSPMSAAVSTALLPICLCQSLLFLQIFLFQASAYRWQKPFLFLLKTACTAAFVCLFISQKAFACAYQLQLVLSALAVVAVCLIHRRRICFVLRNQARQLLYSCAVTVLPFCCYVAAFHRQAAYMAGMGSYLAVLLTLVSIHSIVFASPHREQSLTLKKSSFLLLISIGTAGLITIACLFRLPPAAAFILVHFCVLLALFYSLLLYKQIQREPESWDSSADPRSFYSCSLAQIRREENLRQEFSNYLHDQILQDLFSAKNLVQKAEQPEVRQLLSETLSSLNTSIRQRMQFYHPILEQNLTLRENLQSLLDELTAGRRITASLECAPAVFLVEPYPILIYRMIGELTSNALKHSKADHIRVSLDQKQDRLLLIVGDDGEGFDTSREYPAHRGLASIREQVSFLGGNMTVRSAPGAGTEIVITIPMKGENSYENFIDR